MLHNPLILFNLMTNHSVYTLDLNIGKGLNLEFLLLHFY